MVHSCITHIWQYPPPPPEGTTVTHDMTFGFKSATLSYELGPLACFADGFLNGLSCYKENNKDTWTGAKQECIDSGGDLVKIYDDDDENNRFLSHFVKIIGLKEAEIDVSTSVILMQTMSRRPSLLFTAVAVIEYREVG